jgi:hypothetical protein
MLHTPNVVSRWLVKGISRDICIVQPMTLSYQTLVGRAASLILRRGNYLPERKPTVVDFDLQSLWRFETFAGGLQLCRWGLPLDGLVSGRIAGDWWEGLKQSRLGFKVSARLLLLKPRRSPLPQLRLRGRRFDGEWQLQSACNVFKLCNCSSTHCRARLHLTAT